MPHNRRSFLHHLGTSFLAPLAGPWLLRRSAYAATRPTRLVVFFTPNGTKHDAYWPTGSGAAFDFSPGSILEPLKDIKSQVLIMKGIHIKTQTNHEPGQATMLTGVKGTEGGRTNGQSIDQWVSARIGAADPVPNLALGALTDVWGANTQTRMLYSAGHKMVNPDQNPSNTYQRLFAGRTGQPSAQVDAALRRRRSVLDLIKDDLAQLKTEVAALDKQEQSKLLAHTEALFAMEKRMTGAGTPVSCTGPSPVAAMDVNAHDNFPAVARAQMDMMVLALSCGLTHVASMQMAHTVGPLTMTWLGQKQAHHELSHQKNADFVTAERWYAGQFAYLCKSLAALPDPAGEGSVLDNTLVVWSKELGDGNLHDGVNVPWVLAGASKFLNTGRYLDFGGEPHNKLLTSIANIMGADTPSYGSEAFGTGGLNGLLR